MRTSESTKGEKINNATMKGKDQQSLTMQVDEIFLKILTKKNETQKIPGYFEAI